MRKRNQERLIGYLIGMVIIIWLISKLIDVISEKLEQPQFQETIMS